MDYGPEAQEVPEDLSNDRFFILQQKHVRKLTLQEKKNLFENYFDEINVEEVKVEKQQTCFFSN